MASVKTRTAIAVTVGLWLAAAGTAAAFTYHLNRGLDSQPPGSEVARSPGTEVARSSGGPAPASVTGERVLSIPTIEIVAPRPRRPARISTPAPSTPVARDISEMGCSPSRELDIGSGRVRFCESVFARPHFAEQE
jgi:hypothetical protein